MEELFDRFITERVYLKNITARTESSYKNAKTALFRLHGKPFAPEELSREKLTSWIISMRQNGLSVGACNVYIRTVNAFLNWMHQEGLAKERIRLSLQKEEQKLIVTVTESDIARIIKCSVTGSNLRRAHLLALLILDTGLRASEALSLTKQDVTLDQLIIRVLGKGGKHRLVPFSFELRKLIFRHFSAHRFVTDKNLLFGTKNNTKLTIRNFERDLKVLGDKLGLALRPHLLRHTFSVEYLKRGGNLEYLRRILGHKISQLHRSIFGVWGLLICRRFIQIYRLFPIVDLIHFSGLHHWHLVP